MPTEERHPRLCPKSRENSQTQVHLNLLQIHGKNLGKIDY